MVPSRSFEFGTASCVIEANATNKDRGDDRWYFTLTPKNGCDYLRNMMAEHNKTTINQSSFEFCLDKNTTVESQLEDFPLYEWDFDPDMDHRWPDFFIQKTEDGNCSMFRVDWGCRRPIF
ncbi:hypothetical protein AAVH_27380 [Aphelenchoides avenae]|nr:hypothetical protein AAVH_27380 [Aphelenchus avenae]